VATTFFLLQGCLHCAMHIESERLLTWQSCLQFVHLWNGVSWLVYLTLLGELANCRLRKPDVKYGTGSRQPGSLFHQDDFIFDDYLGLVAKGVYNRTSLQEYPSDGKPGPENCKCCCTGNPPYSSYEDYKWLNMSHS
jgi:hypothetical protein